MQPSSASRLPGLTIAVPKAPAVKKRKTPSLSPYETVRYYQEPCYLSWGERESLYDDGTYGCYHDSGGLCASCVPVVRRAKTTKEAWELMYFNKHGKWADVERQSWLKSLDAPSSPAYSPTDYSPWSSDEGS